MSDNGIIQVDFGDFGANEFCIFGLEKILTMSLAVVRSAVGAVTSPGKLIRLPPTLIWV